MNKQSNIYTIIYASVLVLVVGVGLSLVYQALRPLQVENANNDTRRQILAAALIAPQKGESIGDLYREHIKSSFIVDFNGNKVDSSIDPFDINVADEVKKPENKRLLPVFVCSTSDGDKYIIPVYGAGLWGPIWGYMAFDSNGDTIYGAYFAHQGETPGLGAEIEKPAFQDQFQGKNIYTDSEFTGVAVVKKGQEPSGIAWVHAISGGTITSQGVQAMIANSLAPYNKFFLSLQNQN